MKNTIELIMEASIKVAHGSKLKFLKNDLAAIAKENLSNNEMVEKLKGIFENANYAGDYKAGQLSFLLDGYLNNYDVTEELKEIITK